MVAKAGQAKTLLDQTEAAVIPLAGPPIPVLSIPNQPNRHVDSLQALPPNQTANSLLRRAHGILKFLMSEDGLDLVKKALSQNAGEGRVWLAPRSEQYPGIHRAPGAGSIAHGARG